MKYPINHRLGNYKASRTMPGSSAFPILFPKSCFSSPSPDCMLSSWVLWLCLGRWEGELTVGVHEQCPAPCVCFLRGDGLYLAPDSQSGQKPLPQMSVSFSIQSSLALTVP